MLFEMRTYQLLPSRLKDYLGIYAEKGRSLQCDVLGHLAGCYTTEVGDLNQVIFLWGFSSFEDRVRRRRALASLAAWQAYVAEVAPLFVRQESRLLMPAAFGEAPPMGDEMRHLRDVD
ncbi:hypothetical protein APR50_31795 [Variovorax paradoxus]|jgi:hypothetical protein|uniref:NIPSNAP family protein n=2 Tax=Variovorax paradoxus TaxID=34073 RepID=UPI0006E5EEBC|nr:hypothetical protein APR52_38875 [Variovorax paradoxus]KPV00809.1 hypothetical protein APR50_31795 [Variovorax paradoxus]KPV01672.1 hypothetical protein APR49_30890 [Variovorax paradoxus]KPV17123.1 hypothetical protein APR51_28140 [Variovorax paradoxus]KPV26910.1 hypothetical protein APR48_29925 [Variovorax paradoxus]